MQIVVLSAWSQTATLKGKVSDKHSAVGVELANVYADSLYLATSTSADGEFVLPNLPVGKIILCVSHINYDKYCQPIVLKAGVNELDIALSTTCNDLNPLVVTGTGTSHRVDDVPVQTEIITKKDIAELSGKSVEEVLSNVSSSIDFTSSGMGVNLKVNGLGKDYVLVLIDGKRLTGGVGGYADLSRVNTEDIEQIEIVKGASSTLYGSDAIAGVVNIITKKKEKKFSVSNNTRVGAYGELKQLNTVSFSRGKWASKTSVNYKQTDGYQLNDMQYNTKWERNHDLPYLKSTHYKPVNKTRAYTVRQGVDYDVNDVLNLNADLSWYEKRLFFPFKAQMHDYYYNNRTLGFEGKYKFNQKNFLTFSADYGRYLYYTEYPYKFNDSYITTDGVVNATYYPGDDFKNSDQTNINVLAKGVFHLNEAHTLSAGAELMGEKLEAQFRLVGDDVSALTYALYAQDEYQLTDRIDLVAGLRGIYHTQSGAMLTPKMTGMYKGDTLTHRLTYSNGFKSPTLKELYYSYESDRMGIRRLYLGNEDLKPQVSHYTSWSTEYKGSQFSTGVNLYVNQINNKIEYAIIPTSSTYKRRGIEETKKRFNIEEARSTGVDWHFSVNILKQLTVAGGYSYVDARNVTQDIRLNGVSAHSATAKLAWKKKWQTYDLGILLTGVYKSDRFYLEDDDRRTYARPYQLWKLTTSHTIKTFDTIKMTGVMGVDNVLDYVDDSPYGSHYGTLNPGRTVFVGLNIVYNKKD